MEQYEIIKKRIVKTIVLEQRLHLENVQLAQKSERAFKTQEKRISDLRRQLSIMLENFNLEGNLNISDKAVRANLAIEALLLEVQKEKKQLEYENKKYGKEDCKNSFGLSCLFYSLLEGHRGYDYLASLVDNHIEHDKRKATSFLQQVVLVNIQDLEVEMNTNLRKHALKIPSITNKDRGMSGFKNDLEKSLLNDKKVKFLNKETLKKITVLVDKNFKIFEKLLMARYMFYRRNIDDCVTINLTKGDEIYFKFHHQGKLKKVKLNELE